MLAMITRNQHNKFLEILIPTSDYELRYQHSKVFSQTNQIMQLAIFLYFFKYVINHQGVL